MNNKINASLCIGSYLDTLGFKDGNWEFNFGLEPETLIKASLVLNEITHQYFALGGNNIDISKWNASDDTILMIATKNAVIKGGKDKDYIEEYLKSLPELIKDKRQSGFSTIKSLNILKKTKKLSLEYSSNMGGNGAAIRTAFIGLKYNKKDDFNKLLHQSIFSSRLTHNYTVGFLGGFVTAYFCSLAMNNIDPFKWAELLISKINNIDNYMKKTDIYDNYMRDKDLFWDLWKKYIEERLLGFEYKSKEYIFSADRYNELIKYTPGISKISPDYGKFAASGIGAVIVAYDSLLMSYNFKKKEYNFENLVFFSTLHFGDNDSTGIIAGCWYGALNGFKDFSKDKIDMLEFKDLLYK
jgi:ADP-ribosylarginine hydrolase